MKINIVTSFFPPERGAAPSRLMNTALGLKERGCDVEIIATLPNYPKGKIFEGYRGKLFHKEEIKGIPCRRYWLYPSNSNNPFVRVLSMFSFSFSMFFALPYLWRRKPDLIIVQSPPLLAGLAGVYLTRLAGAKAITNISDVWPMTALELGIIKKGSIYTFFEWVEKKIYKKSTGFIGQSGETITHIAKFQKEKPSFQFRNLSKASPYLHKGPKYQKGKLKLVYAGLLGLAQGVAGICEQIDFKKMGIEFHIYGHGVERKKVEEYLSNNPNSNIILHDSIPKEEVPEMLSNFHGTIVPLKNPIYGAFPSKVFMAISAGLPIFFSGGREGEKLVDRLNIGWVSPPGDHQVMAKELEKFSLMGEDAYEIIRKNIISACENEFDFEKQNDKLLNFLENV